VSCCFVSYSVILKCGTLNFSACYLALEWTTHNKWRGSLRAYLVDLVDVMVTFLAKNC